MPKSVVQSIRIHCPSWIQTRKQNIEAVGEESTDEHLPFEWYDASMLQGRKESLPTKEDEEEE